MLQTSGDKNQLRAATDWSGVHVYNGRLGTSVKVVYADEERRLSDMQL